MVIVCTIITILACIRAYFFYTYVSKIQNNERLCVIGDILQVTEKSNIYVVEVQAKQVNGKKTFIRCKYTIYYKKNNQIEFCEGEKIKVEGKISKFDTGKNEGKMSYQSRLLSKKICCCIEAEDCSYCNMNLNNYFLIFVGQVRASIRRYLYGNLPEDNASLCAALILGEKNDVDDDILTSFSEAGLSHIIAISGMHTIYVASIVLIFKKKIGVRMAYVLVVFCLIFFCYLTHNSESVRRASIMLSMLYMAKVMFRNSDSLSNLFWAILICVADNPFCIYNTGFLLSVGGAFGIIAIDKHFHLASPSNKIIGYIVKQTKTGLAANIAIIPILAKLYNKFSLTFFISSSIVNCIVGIIMPVLLFTTILSGAQHFIPSVISKLLAVILRVLSNALMLCANIFRRMSFLCVQVKAPSLVFIIGYYLIVYLVLKYRETRKKQLMGIIKLIVCVYVCFSCISICIPFFDKSLSIYFVDVGQGDCTIIKTPNNKTIIIDGGGGEDRSQNEKIASQTIIPFLLNKSIFKIDYIIISHFDSDHVGALLVALEKMKVANVVIAQQSEMSENYKKFTQIVAKRKINVVVVKKGDILNVDPNVFFNILWPDSKLISDNPLNNNSIVCKLNYNNFSMLFTGDIETVAEKGILEVFSKEKRMLKATCLKVAHHGSRTSSCENFVEAVNPNYVVIGVGLNNKFGHPNAEVIERFEKAGACIYRTDLDGEIIIKINEKSMMKIKKYVQ